MPDPVSDRIDALSASLAAGTTITGAGVTAAAPAAGTVIADTGALAAGSYEISVACSGSGALAAGIHAELQHRNAANTANVTAGPVFPLGTHGRHRIRRVTVLANERFRLITVGVGPAGAIYGGRIDATPVA